MTNKKHKKNVKNRSRKGSIKFNCRTGVAWLSSVRADKCKINF